MQPSPSRRVAKLRRRGRPSARHNLRRLVSGGATWTRQVSTTSMHSLCGASPNFCRRDSSQTQHAHAKSYAPLVPESWRLEGGHRSTCRGKKLSAFPLKRHALHSPVEFPIVAASTQTAHTSASHCRANRCPRAADGRILGPIRQQTCSSSQRSTQVAGDCCLHAGLVPMPGDFQPSRSPNPQLGYARLSQRASFCGTSSTITERPSGVACARS